MSAIPYLVLTNVSQDASVDAQTALANGGRINVYAADDTLLFVVPVLGTPAWQPSSGGVAALTGAPLSSSPAVAGGDANYYKVISAGSVELWRGTVGVDSSFNLIMSSVTIVLAQVVVISFLNHTQPNP